jgi:hypothetical protein
METSCVNKEIQIFNRKLRKFTKVFKHVTIIELNNNRETFTRHGLHLNKLGKQQIAKQMAKEIRRHTDEKLNSIIGLDWKQGSEATSPYGITVQADKSNQLPRDEMRNMQEVYREITRDGIVTTSSIVNCEESVKKVEGKFEELTLTNSLENLVSMGNSSTKVSRISKRSKRPPLTMTNDFLW